MINQNVVEAAVNKYQTQFAESTRWKLANQVLYDLCSKYPAHTDEDQIVAKIWLIGRSYAAAIERRKNAEGYVGDFYYQTVAPSMKFVGTTLDEKIARVNSTGNVGDVLDTHAYLMGLFNSLTDMNKRSLASKYLHFHCPNAVFIYDSVASTALRKMVKKPENKKLYISGNRDPEYVDFCLRAQELKEYILAEYRLDLTIRQLDTLLINA